jgi:hypothetical protein
MRPFRVPAVSGDISTHPRCQPIHHNRGVNASASSGHRPEDAYELADAVDELLDELPRLTAEDTLLLAQLWEEEDAGARSRAWQHAKAAIERSGVTDILDRAREDVGYWMQATPADYQGISGLLGREGDHVSIRRAAAPAVLDAVAGLLAERELHAGDFDLLTRPWRVATDRSAEESTAD